MQSLTLLPTNRCYRHCLHCIQNRADPDADIPLELLEHIFSQARNLNFLKVYLTGGEVALYPDLGGLLRLIVAHGFEFTLMTSGFLFGERLLPLLLQSDIRDKLRQVCFSLDGARAETHEALRGRNAFRDVLAAAAVCKDRQLPFSLKSMITPFNRDELTQMALLGASLGAREQVFLTTTPTSRLLDSQAILTPAELNRQSAWIMNHLAPALKTGIGVSGYTAGKGLNSCPHIFDSVCVDFQGHLILCCDLVAVREEDGVPSRLGGEFLANLREVSFQEGLIRHYHAATRLAEDRLNTWEEWKGKPFSLCYWCYRRFGKLEWLKHYPDSPWAAGVLEGACRHPA